MNLKPSVDHLRLPSFIQSLVSLFTPAFMLGVLLSALLIFSGGYYLKQNYQDHLSETASVTTKGVSSLFSERVQNYHTVLQSIANHHQDRVFELASGGGYPYDLTEISDDLFNLFSEVKGFSVIDSEGRDVVGSHGESLGPLCEAQTKRILRGEASPENVELHRANGGYHFDVIAKVERGEALAALFASFSLRPMHQLLAKFETAELKLSLVDQSDPKKIILTSGDFVGERPDRIELDQTELDEALASEEVAQTHWMLLAQPVNHLISEYAQKINVASWLLFLLVITVLLLFQYYLRRANLARFQAEKKASYSALFNAGPTVLFEKNLQAGMAIEYVSPNVKQLFGFTPQELISERSFYDLVHPDDLARFKRALNQAVQNRIPSFEIEYRLMGADWRYLWVYSLVHLNQERREGNGKVQCYITSIHEQKLAEQQATSLIENAPDAMFVSDAQGRVIRLNKMAEKMFDYHDQALVAHSMRDLVPCYDEVMGRIKASDEQAQQECTGHIYAGKEVPLSVSVSAMQSADGEVFVSAIRDISVQKEAEERMRMAKEQAESLAEERRRFMAMISHEIRTPMNGVLGMADLLAATSLNNDQKTYVEVILESGGSLISILNDVLDFSKLEEGLVALHEESFQLQEVVDRSIQLLTPQARLGQMAIQQAYAQGCPAMVKGDALRLRQILLNLIGNAIKFSPKGQVYVSVDLAENHGMSRLAPGQVGLQFTIQDNGIGIEKAHQKALFTPFKQVDDSISRHYGGTGLGLAITKQLVELMGGEIQLTSEPEQGSTFIVTLPFKRAESGIGTVSQSDGRAVVSAQNQAPDADHPCGKVLLVEDDAVNQQIAEAFLEKLELEPVSVNNGLEALEFWRLHHNEFDLILMDCQMPIMDGYEATRLIRYEELQMGTKNPAVIIAFTANAYAEDEKRCLDSGMNDFMIKPLFADQFYDKLFAWMPQLKKGAELKTLPH